MKRDEAIPKIEDAVRRVHRDDPPLVEALLDALTSFIADPGNHKPKWLHNCDRCLFIGHFSYGAERNDVFVCDSGVGAPANQFRGNAHGLVVRFADNSTSSTTTCEYAEEMAVISSRYWRPEDFKQRFSNRMHLAYQLALARQRS